MRGSFLFKIEINNEKFDTGNFITEKTARVTFIDNHENIQQTTEYGVVNVSNVYEDIHNEKSINLSNCYINNFSLVDYKKKYKLKENSKVELENFVARHSFFEADETIDFSDSEFTGEDVDFDTACFGSGNLSFYKSQFKTSKKVSFKNAFFGKGHTNFQYSSFDSEKVNFENATNVGDITFVNSNFGNGTINFKNVSFGDGLVEFHFSKFGDGLLCFNKAIFEGKRVDFRRVEFGKGRLDFRRVDFGNANVLFDECEIGIGKATFNKSQFGTGNISFYLANIKAELFFEKTEFGTGSISFYKAKLNSLSFKSCHLDNYIDLRVEHCKIVDLSDTVIRDVVDFHNDFSKVKINELNLIGLRNLGKLILNWKLNKVEGLIENQDSNVFQKAEQYRLLKENFHSFGRYEDEDEAYVRFKRYELKHNFNEQKSKGGLNIIIAYVSKWGQQLLFDKMGKYATQPFRVLVSMFLIYLLFSFTYLLMIKLHWGDLKPAFENPEQMPDLILSFYHSAITFLTIGYGDYAPWGVIRIVSSFEGFVGLFMMSYFTVAFVRKILR